MNDEYKRYFYVGPVTVFNRCVSDKWCGETVAPTLSKARSNLTYQAKKQLKLIANSRVTLPGKITTE